MLAQVIGYTLREVVYTFSDVHIYESQYEKVKELIAREPKRLPTVLLDPSLSDIFAFRPEHFSLTDYEPHPKMLIPTPL
jgi:thymidylate synthase